ncbi:MAG TPA: polysaccharide biosynthesis/export family protein [Balneolales bacterium]|nr:polysaccharide biosynthesis/export family protein [Balneolales bacterium]
MKKVKNCPYHDRVRGLTHVIPYMILGGLFISSMLLSACSASRESAKASAIANSQQQKINRNQKNYIIQSGDQIAVTVWNHDQFNIKQVVSNSGTISYPLLGDLDVNGMTKADFMSMLKKKLANFMNSDINLTVSITRPNDKEVIVLGSVKKPANYPIDKSSSILQVLAEAGGPSDNADLRNVQVYRPGTMPNKVKINLDTYFAMSANPNSSDPPFQVSPGDIIYIPKNDNIIRDLSGFMQDAVILFGIFRVFN